MNLRTTLIVFLCFCATTVLRAERVDMLKAGAKANGKTLNTKLINSTIDRLNRGGGGTLFFPAGTYLTGSIHLKSNITLELEAGATLLFSDNFDDYLPFVEVRHEGVMMKSFQPLIYAVDAENITIKGEGTLDGQGKKWWMEFFRVMIDLKDNGMRDVNKYQSMWDAANDTTAIYAETNKDYVNTLQRRFFRPPFIPPSSPMVNKISVLRHGRFCSLITLTASMIAAIPDLSSPERIVDPSVWIIPSSINGLIPLPGVTVSMCAHIIVGSPGIVPGRYAHTLNPLDPNPSPALSVFTSRPSAFRSSTNFSPIAFSFFVSLSIIA